MRCETFQWQMHQLLDQRALPEDDPQLQQHAQHCPGCRALLEGQQRLFEGLAVTHVPEPSADFARRVVSQAVARPAARRYRYARLGTGLLAVASCLLLALWLSPHGQPPGQQQSAAVSPATVRPQDATTNGPPPTTAASQTAGLPTWWMLDPDELYPDDLRQQHRQQVDRIADDLRPLTRSFSTAAAALGRWIPVSKPRTNDRTPQARRPLRRWLDQLS
jgi:hypothetical protein